MANKLMKSWSTSLTTGEMQIKATLRYCFTGFRMTTIKKTRDQHFHVWCRCYGQNFPQNSYVKVITPSTLDYVCVCVCVCEISHSVLSESLQPHGLVPARLLCP